MNESHSCLKILLRSSDYVQGDGHINFNGISSGDWSSHFDFFERQRTDTYDTNGCVLFSAQESFDAQMDLLIQENIIPTSMLNQFHAMGYMDLGYDGLAHFHSSARFLQIKTGSGFNGNAIQEAWDAMRKYGILPWKDLPFNDSVLQSDYLNGVTSDMQAKALQFLNLIGGKKAIQYHWIRNNQLKNIPSMVAALPQAPLCLGIATNGGWNQAVPIDPPTSTPPGHCVANDSIQAQNCNIIDHYVPYSKTLDAGYPINYTFQGIVSPIIAPPLPPSLPPQPTNSQIGNWLTKISQWLLSILQQIHP